MFPSLTMQRVPSSCSGTALARLIPEPPSLLGPNLCTSYYADNSPSTKAHNLSRIIEEHDGTLSHFNNGRATHRSHAPHAPISSRSNQTRMTRVGSNLSEASEVIKPTAPPMNINSDKVTMEMVNQFEINRRLHQSRALPKTFTSTRHRRAHIARQGRRNPLKKVQRLPIIHNAVSNHLKPWKVGNGVSKVFAQAVYDPPGREDFLQQTFTYLGRPGGRRPPVRFDQLDGDADGKVSKDEWIARLGTSKGFDEYDLNGDGVVTKEEYRKGRMKMVTQKRNTVHRR